MVYIESRKRKEKTLRRDYPDAVFIDLTSKAAYPFIKFSPFYPHGKIPVPFSDGAFAMSVEGIWQGLKVFEKEDVDASKFEVDDMKGIKRSVRKFGKPKGHRKGVNGKELLGYIQARKEIYLPSYRWVLQHYCLDLLHVLKEISKQKDLVFLDYTTNENVEDPKKPLSHAALVKRYIDFLLRKEDNGEEKDKSTSQLNLFKK